MRRHQQRGFTLLEVMVAMMITAMIMTITYTSLREILRADESITNREDQLQQWMHLQTLLQRDAGFLKSGKGAAFELFADGVKARYDGSVVPKLKLGTGVAIHYSWSEEESADGESNVSWQRNLYTDYNDSPVIPLQIVLDQGLRGVNYELMVDRDWIDAEQFVQGSIRAMRWTFEWSLIGEWQLVIPVG